MSFGEVRPSHAVQYGAVVCGVGVAYVDWCNE
jgi:hypothetical protein